MIEVIRKDTGESVVYTDALALDKAYAAGVPELLVMHVINHVLNGDIEPAITDGGYRFTRSNSKYVVNVYHNRKDKSE